MKSQETRKMSSTHLYNHSKNNANLITRQRTLAIINWMDVPQQVLYSQLS